MLNKSFFSFPLFYHQLTILAAIVVQHDLADALRSGVIFAAGVDVMVPEPLLSDDPLAKLPNCGK